MTGLAPRQAEVLRFIARFIASEGYPPTLREIGEAISVESTNGVADHLNALERKGMLRLKPMISRGIVLTDQGRAWIASDLARHAANDIANNPAPAVNAEPAPIPEPDIEPRGRVG